MEYESKYTAGPATFLVCVDAYDGRVASGTFFSCFLDEGRPFPDLAGFLREADRVMDANAYPQAYFRRRGFIRPA